jgi:hypothetical protein
VVVFGAVEMKLRGEGDDLGSGPTALAADDGDIEATCGQFLVPGGKASERTLEVTWRDGRREIDRDTEIAVDIFCEYLANALDALQESRHVKPTPGPGARLKPM